MTQEIIEFKPDEVEAVKQSPLYTTAIEKKVSETTAVAIVEQFGGFYSSILNWQSQANDVLEMDPAKPETAAAAKRLRLDIRKQRTSANSVREELKRESLQRGNAIQGVYNQIKAAAEILESKLAEVENFAAEQERMRIQALANDRKEKLDELGYDHSAMDLGAMNTVAFTAILEGAQALHEKKVKEQEEADRLKREEAERIQKENERKEAELKAINERLPKLAQTNWTGENVMFGDVLVITRENLISFSDKEFDLVVENHSKMIAAKKAEEDARAKRQAEWMSIAQPLVSFGEFGNLAELYMLEESDFDSMVLDATNAKAKQEAAIKKAEEDDARYKSRCSQLLVTAHGLNSGVIELNGSVTYKGEIVASKDQLIGLSGKLFDELKGLHLAAFQKDVQAERKRKDDLERLRQQEAEREAQEAAEKAEKARIAKAGDAEKAKDLIAKFEAIEMPKMRSSDGKYTISIIEAKIVEIKALLQGIE